MKDVTDKNFGVIIAFWLPGFLLLWGLSYSSNDIAVWLINSSKNDAPTVGGFLYATLASLALGLMISAVRWLIIDHLFYFTGWVKPLPIDFAKLKEAAAFAAFQGVVENHYRYYQYYSNTLVAVLTAFGCYIKFGPHQPSLFIWSAAIAICIALLLAARDCLNKYHERASAITR